MDIVHNVAIGSFDLNVQFSTRASKISELRKDGASDSGVKFLDWGTEVFSGYLEAFGEICNCCQRVGTHQFLYCLFDFTTMTIFGHDIEREAIASAGDEVASLFGLEAVVWRKPVYVGDSSESCHWDWNSEVVEDDDFLSQFP